MRSWVGVALLFLLSNLTTAALVWFPNRHCDSARAEACGLRRLQTLHGWLTPGASDPRRDDGQGSCRRRAHGQARHAEPSSASRCVGATADPSLTILVRCEGFSRSDFSLQFVASRPWRARTASTSKKAVASSFR